MSLIPILIKMGLDPQYRKKQLSTDKNSVLLILVGLPIGILILFGLLYLLMSFSS